MRLGIPRALYTYYNFPFWRRFVTDLGAEVVLSPATDREILNSGLALAPAEACLPLKAYLGHVAWLRGRCDAIFVPRLVSARQPNKVRFGCPKAIALPDVVRACVSDLPPVLEWVRDELRTPLTSSYLNFARLLNPDHRGRIALNQGLSDQQQFSDALRAELPFELAFSDSAEFTTKTPKSAPGVCSPSSVGSRVSDAGPGSGSTIAVIGHPYLVFDHCLSLGLPEKLSSFGVKPLYLSQAPEAAAFSEPTRPQEISWLYEQELLAAASYSIERRSVAGLLLVSSFACGTSAVVNDIISRELAPSHMPVMTILLDEQTAESGLMTRLEAFVDMVRHHLRPKGRQTYQISN
jgi:predicted nucleotide-binding protein (sugar kinase/HSP70/actin superfamily)